MNIDEKELESHQVSRELIDGIRAIPSEIEHNMIMLTRTIVAVVEDLPADLGAKIRRDSEKRFLDRAADQIPRGGRLAPVVADVIAEVRESARMEHERLRPKTKAEALKPWLGRLDELEWRAAPKRALEGILEPGEEITAVDFRTATTNRRTITMDALREWTLGQRPKWQVDLPDSLRPSEFLARAGFPSDEAITALERKAELLERESHRRTSGPRHLVGEY